MSPQKIEPEPQSEKKKPRPPQQASAHAVSGYEFNPLAPALAGKGEGVSFEPGGPFIDPRLRTVQQQAFMEQIGQTQGNQFLQRMMVSMQRGQMMSDGKNIQREDGEADPARDSFMSTEYMPSEAGQDFQPSTGLGGFNVRYSPQNSELRILLHVGIDFQNSLSVDDAGLVTANTGDFATAAADLNSIPDVAIRTTEVQNNWQWSEGDKTSWAQDYQQQAQDAWGGQFYFTSERWSDVFANVRVVLDVHANHLNTDHCKATVFKVPAGSSAGPGAEVVSTQNQPVGYTATMVSSDLQGTGNFLDHTLYFQPGSDSVATAETIDADPAPGFLSSLIATFQRGTSTGGVPITVTGHTMSGGDEAANQVLSEQRAQNVVDYLHTHGAQIAGYRLTARGVGAAGATADDDWERVDIQVGSGGSQQTMVHETGHMFGLGDQYVVAGLVASGTGGRRGTRTEHDPQVQNMGGVQTSIYENNDDIMSLGSAIRPQHYSTFHQALTTVAPQARFVYGGVGSAPRVPPDLINPYGEPNEEPTTAVA
jgi:outer membrane protein OmpA-like peptidoglycan-associated protein